MIRSFLTVSSGTLASRLLGFARDAMLAALLGTGAVADAFLVAFQGVNVVRRLLTEGALNASLVPAWLRVREAEGTAAAAAFAGSVLGTVSAALVVAAALIGLLMPLVISALAPGFAATPTLQLAVDDARLMLPYLAFAGPVTVMMALLNAQGRFALTAFSPLLFNIALIAVMAALLLWRQDAGFAALVVAATVGVAGLLQLLILVSHGGGLATPLRISFDAPMRGFLGKAVPGMIASSGPQLLMLAGAIIASSSPSAVSWLYFANRLIELPLGLVGVAIGAVLVPELTRGVRAGDRSAIAHAESRGLELSVGLALPATLGLIALSEPIVRLLFQHGAFTAADTAATAQGDDVAGARPARPCAGQGAVAGLFRARGYAHAAQGDSATDLPSRSCWPWCSVHLYGASGIAAAIACGAWSSALGLIRRGAATFGFSIDAAARRRLPRIVAAALVMGGLLWLAAAFALPMTATAHGLVQAALLGVLIAGGMALYGLLLALFGVTSWAEAKRAIRQTRASGLRD